MRANNPIVVKSYENNRRNRLIMSENTDEIESIESSANSFRASRSVSGKDGLAAAYRCASAEYFGEDITGKVTGLTVNALAAGIAVIRGENADSAKAYAFEVESKDELVAELEEAFAERGILGEDGPLAEVSAYSVGPVLPWLLGVLSVSHEIDVAEVTEPYGDVEGVTHITGEE